MKTLKDKHPIWELKFYKRKEFVAFIGKPRQRGIDDPEPYCPPEDERELEGYNGEEIPS